jgi:hypothetical protein
MYLSSLKISGKSCLSRGSCSQHLCIKEASLVGHYSGSSGRKRSMVIRFFNSSPILSLFKRSFTSQDLVAHKIETVHVCFEGYAGSCSPGTTAPRSIENTSGAIHKVVLTFDVCLENLVLEIFVLDVPKLANFALRYPSLYSSSRTPSFY